MIPVDLITGFLGAGKTTFLKRYAAYHRRQGARVCILLNDFGAVNVDLLLLKELLDENCCLEMVSGAYDADCHRRRFKTKLIAMAMAGYDRVLIEPSGLFDMDEFFDALHEPPLDQRYCIGSVITIVDALLPLALSKPSDCLLAEQAASAGVLVFSRVSQASSQDLAAAVDHLHRAMEMVHCSRRFHQSDLLQKDWEDLTDEDFARIAQAGYRLADLVKYRFPPEKGYRSLSFLQLCCPPEELLCRVRRLFADPACGHIVRVKGFVPQEEGWLELNATEQNAALTPIAEGQEVLLVIGEALNEAAIRTALTAPCH